MFTTMIRAVIAIFLVALHTSAYAQYFTREEGIVLLQELKSARSDSAKITRLVKVAEYHTFASYDHPANFDSAALLLRQAESLNALDKVHAATIEIMMAKSFLYRYSGKREQGRKIITDAINLLKPGEDYTFLGKSYYELSNYYDYDFKVNTIDIRAGYIEQAIIAFKKGSNINDLGNAYKVLADLHHLVNQYEKALTEIEISLAYYKQSNYKRLEGVYDMYGQLYYARGDYKQALAYELMALKTANVNENAGMQICEIENNVGLTLFKMNDPKSALPHFKNALAIAEKEKDNETVYGLTAHVVESYIALKEPKEALTFLKSIEKRIKKPTSDKFETLGYMYKTYLNLYTVLGQYDAGRFYYDQLLLKSRESDLDVFKRSGYYEEIIKFLIGIKEYPEAQKFISANKLLLESMKDNIGLARNYGLAFSLDTSQGNYHSAINNVLQKNLINDTMLNTSKTNEIKKLEVQYESEKKENDIRLKDQRIKALVQTDVLRQANLDQAKFTRNLTLTVSFLFLVLGTVLFIQYKQKRKANIVITERNDQLNHLLKEKEWLVKEVHHRVKNNLQTVISLLNTQSAYLNNDVAILAIQDSQRRMQAMSLIHQKLYQTQNVSVIDMPAYIDELILYLKDIFNTGSGIHFEQDIEPVRLDVSQAVPVGLILNEIITNSIKYAFTQKSNGIIRVSLTATENRHLQLVVSDNGKGLPDTFNIFDSNTLGMSLVTGLVTQLEGRLTILNESGVKITILFPPGKERMDLEDKSISEAA